MGAALWPKAVRAVEKILLVDGFQDSHNRPLKKSVFRGWDTQWPRLSVSLWDIDPLYGRGLVCVSLQPIHQALAAFLEISLKVRWSLPVDAARTSSIHLKPAFHQELWGQQMSQ